ncbi:MAG: methyltransferase [Alphaproteobacteria bacterium]|jgi:23S rRNA (uracil1939-C5)-methyltransferase
MALAEGKSRIRRPQTRPTQGSSKPGFQAELLIETVGAQGDGLCANGVFVPLTLPGERVLAMVSGARGDVEAVLTPSPQRVEPSCAHFGICGGCAMQHWDHAPYLAWKAEQIRLALGRERIETEILPAFGVQPGSRRRLALHARRGTHYAAKLGFKARRSWDLVPITVCPVSNPRLVAAFPAMVALAAPLFEHPKSAPTLHVTLTETGIDIDITGVEAKSGGLSADARMRIAETAAAADFARVTLAGDMMYGARTPMVRVGQAIVALPPGAFLQAVPAAEAIMADFVVASVAGADKVADLYCGIGAFALRLAVKASVLAIDSAELAIKALASARATAPGLKAIEVQTRDLARRPLLAQEMAKMDAVVFDPPRTGAAEQAIQIAQSKVPLALGVSCNPATFARDARILTDAGFVLQRLLPVDQFLWSPHVELVGVFSR